MHARLTGLWRHPDFLKLWLGQTISLFGSQITEWALPLAADLILKATPAQMGVLVAARTTPFFLVSLFAGVWVDRLRRRPVLIVADLGRAVLLGFIPLAALAGWLRLEQLFIIAFLTGILTVFFDTAYQAFLPSLVERDQLVEGNSKLAFTLSAAELAGPGLAGGLAQWLTAPIAIALDAVSFVISAFCLIGIRKLEPQPSPIGHPNIWREILEGLQVIASDPRLRAIAASALALNFFGGVYDALIVVYVTRELGLAPLFVGLRFFAGSFSGLFIALWSDRLARHLGLGPSIILGAFLIGLASIFVPLTGGPPLVALLLMGISGLIGGAGNMTYNISLTSVAQSIVPERLLGRYNASLSFIALGLLPLGSLIGGALGQRFGLRMAMVVFAIGSVSAFLWVFLSPLRNLRKIPASAS